MHFSLVEAAAVQEFQALHVKSGPRRYVWEFGTEEDQASSNTSAAFSPTSTLLFGSVAIGPVSQPAWMS